MRESLQHLPASYHTSATGRPSAPGSQQRLDLALERLLRRPCPMCFAQILPSREISTRDRDADTSARMRPARRRGRAPAAPGSSSSSRSTYGFSLSRVSSTEMPTTCRPCWPVLLLELDEPGDLDLARAAPGRPEVEQDDLALVVATASRPCSFDVLQREVEVRRLRVGRTRGAGCGDRRPSPATASRHAPSSTASAQRQRRAIASEHHCESHGHRNHVASRSTPDRDAT